MSIIINLIRFFGDVEKGAKNGKGSEIYEDLQ